MMLSRYRFREKERLFLTDIWIDIKADAIGEKLPMINMMAHSRRNPS